MESTSLPTRLLDGLIKVNKTVVATDKNQITFVNKQNLKAMKEIAKEFGYKLTNIYVSQKIENENGLEEIQIYQGDVLKYGKGK